MPPSVNFLVPSPHTSCALLSCPKTCFIIGSLSMRIFETWTATGSGLYSLLTCPYTTTFTLPSIFSPLEMISTKMWETPLSWNAKCSLLVAVRVSKMHVPKQASKNVKSRESNNTLLSFKFRRVFHKKMKDHDDKLTQKVQSPCKH